MIEVGLACVTFATVWPRAPPMVRLPVPAVVSLLITTVAPVPVLPPMAPEIFTAPELVLRFWILRVPVEEPIAPIVPLTFKVPPGPKARLRKTRLRCALPGTVEAFVILPEILTD